MTTQTMETKSKEITAREKQELAGTETTHPGPVFTPAVDIFETETAITLVADMPGVDADGLTIDLRESVLSIDGRVGEIEREGERPLLREYDYGSFHRQFQLSNLIDQSRIEAVMSNGVLRLVLPKAEAARPRKIEVRAG